MTSPMPEIPCAAKAALALRSTSANGSGTGTGGGPAASSPPPPQAASQPVIKRPGKARKVPMRVTTRHGGRGGPAVLDISRSVRREPDRRGLVGSRRVHELVDGRDDVRDGAVVGIHAGRQVFNELEHFATSYSGTPHAHEGAHDLD